MHRITSRAGAIESRLVSLLQTATTCTSTTARAPKPTKQWTCPQCRVNRGQLRRTIVTATPDVNSAWRWGQEQGNENNGSGVARVARHAQSPSNLTNTVEAGVITTDIPSDAPITVAAGGAEKMRPRPNRTFKLLDYRVELPKALLQKDAIQMFRALHSAREDEEYIRSIPATTLLYILRSINSDNIIEDLKVHLGTFGPVKAHLLEIRPLKPILKEYRRLIRNVITKWRTRENKLSLVHYKELFQCAASIGSKRLAMSFLKDMFEDDISPDTDCYNAILSSIAWNQLYGLRKGGSKERITLQNLTLRAGSSRLLQRLAYRYGLTGWNVGEGGIKDEMLAIFEQMAKSKVNPNEETWCCLILAYAREGDIQGMTSILKRIWNINPDNIGDPTQSEPVINYPTSSPLYPTEQLLTTTAYAFGINNNIPTAIKVVDYISRSYNIQLPKGTWNQLYAWTLILSLNKPGKFARKWQLRRVLPYSSPTRLWELMISDPYNVKPTMYMYNLLVTSLNKAGTSSEIAKRIFEALPLYKKSIVDDKKALARFNAEKIRYQTGLSTLATVHKFERKAFLTNLIKRRNNQYVRRWVAFYLHKCTQQDRKHLLKNAPSFIRRMEHLSPRQVRYKIPTGTIEFSLPDHEAYRWELSSLFDFLGLGVADEGKTRIENTGVGSLQSDVSDSDEDIMMYLEEK